MKLGESYEKERMDFEVHKVDESTNSHGQARENGKASVRYLGRLWTGNDIDLHYL